MSCSAGCMRGCAGGRVTAALGDSQCPLTIKGWGYNSYFKPCQVRLSDVALRLSYMFIMERIPRT